MFAWLSGASAVCSQHGSSDVLRRHRICNRICNKIKALWEGRRPVTSLFVALCCGEVTFFQFSGCFLDCQPASALLMAPWKHLAKRRNLFHWVWMLRFLQYPLYGTSHHTGPWHSCCTLTDYIQGVICCVFQMNRSITGEIYCVVRWMFKGRLWLVSHHLLVSLLLLWNMGQKPISSTAVSSGASRSVHCCSLLI